ncbi:hypothetical protein GE09DRAFT_1221968 [Coniochaeta sp. 2T2.1]|nr:hypothetical protein GE09DRAFT_1221968 [Coniochaeta sp. 2T2.1]
MTMTDSEVESDPSQQRKRISVACGRCRKRKIRCSGDPGGGQPCTTCKNAGSEPCLFLRVSSSEATFRNDPNEYSYNIQDGRSQVYNRHGSVSHGLSSYTPTHGLPSVGTEEIMSPYRGGSAYGYANTKSFYSGVPAYSMGYVEELSDYSSQPVLGQDMVSYPSWTSRGDYGYGGTTTSLVHRPAPSVGVDSTNFSLSNMAAHLPGSGSDRLLPVPSSRSMSLASSQSYKALPPAGGADPSLVDAAAVLADMPSSSYGGSFDTVLPYNSSTTTLQTQTTQGSRTNSEAYSPHADSIFTEHEHSLRSQGSAVDLHAYTYGAAELGGSSLRRGSAAASGGPAAATGNHVVNSSTGTSGKGSTGTTSGSGNSSSGGVVTGSHNHHSYMAMGPIHDSASNPHHHQHHHVPLAAAAAAAVSGGTATASYLAKSPSATGGHATATICNGRVHGDTRRAAVGGRR